MIVATAGHVDHGKTSLVKALTLVDTDRLPEEKQRGISIDLGFAYADLEPDARVGFVDVPGHEKFIRNMVAGITGIDFVLLVVAADDGPRPQTIEHLAILRLLGARHGLVALTKSDRVDGLRLQQVRAQVQSLLAESGFVDMPMLPVSSVTGQGLDVVRQLLVDATRARQRPQSSGCFRMAIDRAFVLAGAGLVVTGTVLAGVCRVGDQLVVSPQGSTVRVRSIHAQNQPADEAYAGQRCALNLVATDVRKVDVTRGDQIVDPQLHAPTQRLDVWLELLDGQQPTTAVLSSDSRLQLHLGTAAVSARVALLQARSVQAGQSGWAQLICERPISALRGDRFVLRDPAARQTWIGGWVVDPFGPVRGRSQPGRIGELECMRLDSPADALRRLLMARPQGIDPLQWQCAWNLAPQDFADLLTAVPHHQWQAGKERRLVAREVWQNARAELLQRVQQAHTEDPGAIGLPERQLIDGQDHMQRPLLRAVIQELVSEHQFEREGLYLRLRDHRPALRPADRDLLARLLPLIAAAGLRPPIVGDLAAHLGLDRASLLESLIRLGHQGHLVQVAPNRFYRPGDVDALVQVARQLCAEAEDGSFGAAAYRDRSGIGRNLTIEVLEFLDRQGYTRFFRGRRWMKA